MSKKYFVLSILSITAVFLHSCGDEVSFPDKGNEITAEYDSRGDGENAEDEYVPEYDYEVRDWNILDFDGYRLTNVGSCEFKYTKTFLEFNSIFDHTRVYIDPVTNQISISNHAEGNIYFTPQGYISRLSFEDWCSESYSGTNSASSTTTSDYWNFSYDLEGHLVEIRYHSVDDNTSNRKEPYEIWRTHYTTDRSVILTWEKGDLVRMERNDTTTTEPEGKPSFTNIRKTVTEIEYEGLDNPFRQYPLALSNEIVSAHYLDYLALSGLLGFGPRHYPTKVVKTWNDGTTSTSGFTLVIDNTPPKGAIKEEKFQREVLQYQYTYTGNGANNSVPTITADK